MSHLIRRLRAEDHPLMKEAADELERKDRDLHDAGQQIHHLQQTQGRFDRAVDERISRLGAVRVVTAHPDGYLLNLEIVEPTSWPNIYVAYPAAPTKGA